VSEDVVIVGAEERPAAPKMRIHGNLDLVLGDEVGLAAMGVKGRLTGRLNMRMNGIEDISGRGEIRLVDGRFQAYGQDLSIERGLILFAGGPIENPALDIVAARVREKEIEEVKVGVRVSGTAEQPVLTLFSDPAMDESDILSYLVIGRPLNEASASEGESLYKEAATSISLAGSETIAKTIGGAFNLTEVNIESGETAEDTALVLGKSVSPRLYIRYVQGLVEESAMFQIRYRLSNKWTLQTESGTTTATGADLIYSFER
jgi:translocation and assembly module TamB